MQSPPDFLTILSVMVPIAGVLAAARNGLAGKQSGGSRAVLTFVATVLAIGAILGVALWASRSAAAWTFLTDAVAILGGMIPIVQMFPNSSRKMYLFPIAATAVILAVAIVIANQGSLAPGGHGPQARSTTSVTVSTVSPSVATGPVPTSTPHHDASPGSTAVPPVNPTSPSQPGPGPAPTSTPTPMPVPTATPTPTPTPVQVTGASAWVVNWSNAGCVVTINVSGTINLNGGSGTVSYYWLRSDSTKSPPFSASISTGTTSTPVGEQWQMTAAYGTNTYWDQLIVTSPNTARSSQAQATVSAC